jgi:carbon storage regulator
MSMIKLSRREGEKILIGDDVEIVIDKIEGGRVKLMIVAPAGITVLRSELVGSEPQPPARATSKTAPSEGAGPEVLVRPRRARVEAV